MWLETENGEWIALQHTRAFTLGGKGDNCIYAVVAGGNDGDILVMEAPTAEIACEALDALMILLTKPAPRFDSRVRFGEWGVSADELIPAIPPDALIA